MVLRVRVRLFAMLRERAGWRERELELGAGSTVGDAWRALAEDVPALARYEQVVRFARNGRYAAAAEPLADGDELAVIPPVAGGAAADAGDADPATLLRCELVEAPITDELLAELQRSVPSTADGALAIFVGRVRETPGPPAVGEEAAAAEHAGQPVTGLDYEAYGEMALAVLREIGGEVTERFGVTRLAMIHRLGHVALGQPSVVVCAAATHREAAFDACRYAIDELKARAPIWKREQYAGGGVWVGAPARQAAVPVREPDAQR
ncbi:molybdopterin converting factor subunit 1 [soil metagenome]